MYFRIRGRQHWMGKHVENESSARIFRSLIVCWPRQFWWVPCDRRCAQRTWFLKVEVANPLTSHLYSGMGHGPWAAMISALQTTNLGSTASGVEHICLAYRHGSSRYVIFVFIYTYTLDPNNPYSITARIPSIKIGFTEPMIGYGRLAGNNWSRIEIKYPSQKWSPGMITASRITLEPSMVFNLNHNRGQTDMITKVNWVYKLGKFDYWPLQSRVVGPNVLLHYCLQDRQLSDCHERPYLPLGSTLPGRCKFTGPCGQT